MSNDLAQTAAPTLPRKSGPKLNEAQRRAVIAHFTACGSIQQTAQQFDLHRNSVSDLVKSVRSVQDNVLGASWRTSMRSKAVVATNAGLDCADDPYKRATIGVSVLKGLGEFNQDSSINVAQLVSNVPADWVSRYSAGELEPAPPADLTTTGSE